MTDPLVQWIIGQVGLAGIASLALMMLRQVYDDRVKEQKIYSEALKGYVDKMMDIVSKNIEANTALNHNVGSLTQTIVNLQRQVEQLQLSSRARPPHAGSGG